MTITFTLILISNQTFMSKWLFIGPWPTIAPSQSFLQASCCRGLSAADVASFRAENRVRNVPETWLPHCEPPMCTSMLFWRGTQCDGVWFQRYPVRHLNVAWQLPLACTVSREHCSLRSLQALTRRFSHVSTCFSCIQSDPHRHLHIHTRTWQHLGTPACCYTRIFHVAQSEQQTLHGHVTFNIAQPMVVNCASVSRHGGSCFGSSRACVRAAASHSAEQERQQTSVPEAFAVQSQMETWRPWSSSP